MKKLRNLFAKSITIILILVLLFNLYFPIAARLTGHPYPALFGLRQAVVLSGSMEPAVGIGDLIVIHSQNAYREGDVVTYLDGQRLVTHRIVEIKPNSLLTQGDANNTPDSPVDPEQVLGKMVLLLPNVGELARFLRTPPGIALILAVGLFISQFNRFYH